MVKVNTVAEFQDLDFQVVDVRSQGEYADSHIPGAINVPLLSNEHRHLVGIAYKKQGKEAAIALGHQLVDPIRDKILQDLKEQTDSRQVRVYCARGGLRSQLMSKFFSDNGYEVTMLKGGYKAYRHQAIRLFSSVKNILVLGGYTGSGKTEVLKELSLLGEQVVDFEGLAEHKGSAFGALGQNKQPSSAQFHNRIYEVLRHFDLNKRIWVENESMTVGKVYIPEQLYINIKHARTVEIELPIEERINHIVETYGQYDLNELSACIRQLNRRLGDQEMRLLCALTEIGDLHPVVARLLKYYDKAYEMSKSKRECQEFVKIPFSRLKPRKIAEFLQTYDLKNQ